MLAMNYRGPYRIRIRVSHRPQPHLEHPREAIVRVTRSAICGADLHRHHGLVPDTRVGSTFGHGFTGVVPALGPAVQGLQVGDPVPVPFNMACGPCFACQRKLYGNGQHTNSECTAMGGMFGDSHTAGGCDGGQAEHVRVPMAGVSPMVIPPGLRPQRVRPAAPAGAAAGLGAGRAGGCGPARTPGRS